MLLSRTLRTIPGQIAGPLAQMAAAVAFTHFLAPEALGVYALAWAAQELAFYGVLAWWTSFVQRYAAAHDSIEDRARLNAAESAVHLCAALVQAVIACAAIALLLKTPPSPLLFGAIVLFTVTRNLVTHFAARSRAEDSDVAFTLLQIVGPVGGPLLGIAALALISPDPALLLLALGLAQAAGLLLAAPFMHMSPARPHIGPDLFGRSLAYGAPLVLANLLEWASNHGVRIIVDIDLGLAEVGMVTVAWWLGLRLANLAALLVTGASFAAAIARLDTDGAEAARRQLADNGSLLLALLVPATVGVILVAQPLSTLLVAADYRAATAELLPLAMVSGMLRAFREHGPEQAFLVFHRPGASVWTSLVEAALTLVLCDFGLRLGGLHGALVGCVIASVVSAAFAYAYAALAVGYRLTGTGIARIALATALMAAAVLQLPAGEGFWPLAASASTGALVYGIASLVLWRGQFRRPLGA